MLTSRSDSIREPRVCREISNSASSSRSWKYAEATSLTRLDITAFWPHSVARRLARADSVARRYLPQKSNCHANDRFTEYELVSKGVGDETLVVGMRESVAEAPP